MNKEVRNENKRNLGPDRPREHCSAGVPARVRLEPKPSARIDAITVSPPPSGSLLVWVTPTDAAETRGEQELAPGVVNLLLDGQQRITSLYGLVRGKAPAFFDGNARAFTDLRFHLEDETFAFYQPLKMRDDSLWIDVTELMQKGTGVVVQRFVADPDYQGRISEFLTRLSRIDNIKEIDLHIEEVTGEDKTIDVVVDIFNRVNSGGTKLSKGDLALAKICAAWPSTRDEMKEHLNRWEK